VDTLTKYVVSVEDKQYKIGITKASDERHFVVEVDGKMYDVELTGIGTEGEKLLQFKLGDIVYTAQIDKKGNQTPLLVRIKDIPLKAEVKPELSFSTIKSVETTLPTPIAKKAHVGKVAIEGAVTAPMTGKIVSVKVKKGDAVKVGEILCVLEAMKMENEIISTRPGTVQKVSVSEGSNVNEGDTLIILE
jgi:biotin carboxyl carrier protein